MLFDKQETTKVKTYRSSSNTHILITTDWIFLTKRILCKQAEKKVKKQKEKLIQVATTQFLSTIKEYGKALSDEHMMRYRYRTRILQNEI